MIHLVTFPASPFSTEVLSLTPSNRGPIKMLQLLKTIVPILLLMAACSPRMGEEEVVVIDDRVFVSEEFFADVEESRFADLTYSQRHEVVEEFAQRQIILFEAEKRELFDDERVLRAEMRDRENLIVNKIINEEVWIPILSDSSLKVLYNRMGREIGVHHIILTYKGSLQSKSDRSEEDALTLIREIRQQIVDGEMKFFEAARKYSEGPSRSQDGSMGRFQWGVLFEPLQTEVFSLKRGGAMSEPFRSDFGYHLVRIQGIKKLSLDPYEEMIPELKEFIKGGKGHEFEVALKKLESMLRKRYAVDFDRDMIKDVLIEVRKIHGDKSGAPKVGEIPQIEWDNYICIAGDVPVTLGWFKERIEIFGSPLTESLVTSERTLTIALEHILYRFLTEKYADQTRDESWFLDIARNVQREKQKVIKNILIEELSEDDPGILGQELIQQLVEKHSVRINQNFLTSFTVSSDS